jgi:NAD(P)H dehydrogenase (quinone)
VLFMVSASESEDRLAQHRAFVDSAAASGVRHIVYTSFAAAAPDATFTLARDHYATEEHIKASGVDWTFLRDGFYIDFMEAMVGDDGVMRGPAGDGRASIVARADIARTATAVLLNPAAHVGRTYDLTGPEALTLSEVAATIARVRGRKISFHDESVEEAYRSREKYGAPDWQVDAWVSTYTAIASDVMADVSGDIEAVTGTAPMSFETYLRSTPR